MKNNISGLLIKKCNDPLFWYSKKIGKIVPYVNESHDYFLSREDAGYINIVMKSDCEIIYK
jgi:hypothetical protein